MACGVGRVDPRGLASRGQLSQAMRLGKGATVNISGRLARVNTRPAGSLTTGPRPLPPRTRED